MVWMHVGATEICQKKFNHECMLALQKYGKESLIILEKEIKLLWQNSLTPAKWSKSPDNSLTWIKFHFSVTRGHCDNVKHQDLRTGYIKCVNNHFHLLHRVWIPEHSMCHLPTFLPSAKLLLGFQSNLLQIIQNRQTVIRRHTLVFI